MPCRPASLTHGDLDDDRVVSRDGANLVSHPNSIFNFDRSCGLLPTMTVRVVGLVVHYYGTLDMIVLKLNVQYERYIG